jgi:hypothetical protein
MAERDFLLTEIRRLTQTTQGNRSKNRVTGSKSPGELIPTTSTVIKPNAVPLLNNNSLIVYKIRLFRFLFRGREDVYPVMWQNKTTSKIGYSPACKNEWVGGLCNKFSVKCCDCPNRELAPLTDQVIHCSCEFIYRTLIRESQVSRMSFCTSGRFGLE